MKWRRQVLFSLVVVVTWACYPAEGEQVVSANDALEKIRTYRFGQDRRYLAAVEQMVVACRANPAQRQKLASSLATVLQSDATYDGKQFVCRQLALIGTERQVPVLAKLLVDEQLSHMALYALMPIGSGAVDEVLRDALDQTRGRTKVGIINAVGNRRDRKATDELIALLGSNEGDVSAAAASALGKISGPKAAGALGTALSRASVPLRLVLADAYLNCADDFLKHGDTKSAAAIYKQMYASDNMPLIQAAALRGLAMSGSPHAPALLIEAIVEGDRQTQRVAAQLVRELPGEAMTKALVEKLPNLPALSQILLLAALADRGDQSASPTVGQLCQSSDESVRIEAVKALGRLGDASAVKLLAERAANSGPAEQDAARKSLNLLCGNQVNARMVEELSQGDAKVRVELVRSLAQRGATEAVGRLLQTAQDEKRSVRVESWRALRELCDREALGTLVELFLNTASEDRPEAAKTVVALARRGADETQRTAPVLTKLKQTNDVGDRSSLLEVLGKIGGEKALITLRESLRDPSPQVRTTAIRALAEWPTDEPSRDLLSTVHTADNDQHRVLALRGYIRLIGVDTSRPPQEAFQMYRQALDLARNSPEKKMALSGLAKVNTLGSLQLVADYLPDEALRQEAEIAVLKITQAVAGSYRGETKEILQTLLRTSKSAAIRRQAQEMVDQIERFGDYITAWEVSGAYTREGAGCTELFDIVFPPEMPEAERVAWRLMPASSDPQQPWLMDLLKALGGDQRVAYLRTRVWSDKAQKLILELGSDDGIKVWLNGKVIHTNNTMRAIAPAQEKIEVSLAKGWNTLMLKVTQNVMGWGACARFRNPDGSEVQGLRFGVER